MQNEDKDRAERLFVELLNEDETLKSVQLSAYCSCLKPWTWSVSAPPGLHQTLDQHLSRTSLPSPRVSETNMFYRPTDEKQDVFMYESGPIHANTKQLEHKQILIFYRVAVDSEQRPIHNVQLSSSHEPTAFISSSSLQSVQIIRMTKWGWNEWMNVAASRLCVCARDRSPSKAPELPTGSVYLMETLSSAASPNLQPAGSG